MPVVIFRIIKLVGLHALPQVPIILAMKLFDFIFVFLAIDFLFAVDHLIQFNSVLLTYLKIGPIRLNSWLEG